MSKERVIDITGLCKSFHDGEKDLHILRELELHATKGECVSIIGRSGTGKSTLLNILGLLDRPTSGKVELCGTDTGKMGETARKNMRGQSIGFIFQQHHLLGDFNALENIMVAGNFSSKNPGRKKAEQLLESVGLKDRMKHKPAKLSGGEQQRVAIARALYTEPKIILCDEPTGNLDPETGAEVMKLVWGLARENDAAMILVTHDMQIAANAERILTLQDGVLLAQ